MLPLFKSHYSIGRSILTLNNDQDELGADSIISIALENKLKKIILVEDSPTGFLKALKACESHNLQLIFGLRFCFCDEFSSTQKNTDSHKVVVFSRSKKGCTLLNSLYTRAFTKKGGFIDGEDLKEFWPTNELSLCIPFYDSFIYKNLFSFSSFAPDLSPSSPTFFLEENGLPFDKSLREKVLSFSSANNFPTSEVQSIYYKSRKDLDAFMTYKLICSRKSFAGRSTSLEKPNLDHLGSDEFCWESYLEKNESS